MTPVNLTFDFQVKKIEKKNWKKTSTYFMSPKVQLDFWLWPKKKK